VNHMTTESWLIELQPDDWQAIWLTIRLALISTMLLLLISTPLALWLATTRSRWRGLMTALVSMPLVLPPTVLGFYLLIAMGPDGPVGQLTQALGIGYLPFTFSGLVVASVVYSLPFVVQPIQNAFESIGREPLEAARILGAGPIDCFFSIMMPLARPGFISAAILGFAHTLGEFGVVLMIGGNIPGETQVLSVQIYEQVESLQYQRAHWLSGLLVAFSFIILLLLYGFRPSSRTTIWR